MRLRAATSQGAIQVAATGYVGTAVVTAARLLDSTVLRSALVKRRSSDLVVIVTDDIYREVVAQGHPGLPVAPFRQVNVSDPRKAFKATGWLRIVEPPVVDPAVVLPAIDASGGPGHRLAGGARGSGVAAVLGGAALGAVAGLGMSATSWDLFGPEDHSQHGEVAADDHHVDAGYGDDPPVPGTDHGDLW